MPRTIYTRGPADKDKSEKDLRDDAEERHYGREMKHFDWRSHCCMDNASTPSILLSTIFGGTETQLEDLNDDFVRTFCFKDCALYVTNQEGYRQLWANHLYRRLYRRWFATRAEDTDISHGAFFCKLLPFGNAADKPSTPALIQKIVVFHKALCETLNDKISRLPPLEAKPTYACPADWYLELPDAIYSLRPIFTKCMLVICRELNEHPHWYTPRRDPGALVVFPEAKDAPVSIEGMSRLIDESIHPAVAFESASLGRAVDYILSIYGRGEKKREWHGHYQEELDQHDELYGGPCECTYCPEEVCP